MTFNDKLTQVIEAFGGNTEFCKRFDLTRQSLWNWRKQGRIPEKMATKISIANPVFNGNFWAYNGVNDVIDNNRLREVLCDLGYDPDFRITITELGNNQWEISQ